MIDLVVDSDDRILASNVATLAVGQILDPSSWRERAVLVAIASARRGHPHPSVGRDLAAGLHWVFRAELLESDPSSPWRARVLGFDATPAVMEDRAAVFAKLVHVLGNIGGALSAVLDVIKLDRPSGDDLMECVAYLYEPVRRLSTIRIRLLAARTPPNLSIRDVTVEAFVAHTLSRLTSRSPTSVTLSCEGMTLACDIDALADAFAAMLDHAGGEPKTVEISQIAVEGRPHAKLIVESGVSETDDAEAVAGMWDLHGGMDLEPQLRLDVGRSVVSAHGGRVLAEKVAPSRVRLGMLVPLIDSAAHRPQPPAQAR